MAQTTVELEPVARDAPEARIDDEFLYGLVAEFEHPDELISAARRARTLGYRRMDAYAPFPVEGLSDALGHRDYLVPWIMLTAGAIGGIGGFAFLYWSSNIDYVLNIGGRPATLESWPSWIPITFEMTVLSAALAGIVGMFAVNGLPSPYHPLFDAPEFDRATSDRFFLAIEARDRKFDREKTREFMETLGAIRVSEVELRK